VKPACLDHLVVGAASLDDGVAWCEATLGVTPGPGGQHALMGTHNRLLRIATVNHPRAYLEIIAIEPGTQAQAGRRRWFGLDDEAVRDDLARHGPRLLHYVAQTGALDTALAALGRLDMDAGTAVPLARDTPRGRLEWRIALRDDERPLYDGCLPALIEWNDGHPATTLSESGVNLQTLTVTHPQADRLTAAANAIGLRGITIRTGPAQLAARLLTPRGAVTLSSARALVASTTP